VRHRLEAGPTVVIALLVIIDMLLVGLAWHHGRGQDPSQVVTIQPASSQHTTHSTSSSPKPTRTSTAPPASPPVKNAAPLVSTVDGTTATLANYGCKGSPDLRTTIDGGATTAALTAPAPHILRVVQTDALNIWVIGADGKCHPTYYSTTDGGQTWSAAGSLGQVWISLPTGVHTPRGKLSKPCGTKPAGQIALSPSGSADAFVVCSDSLRRTSNGGKSWRTVTGLPSGQIVNASLATGGTAVAALKGASGCSGLLLVATANAGGHWSAGQCLKDLKPSAVVAITDAGTGLASSSGVSYITSDAGRSWSAAA